MCAWTEPVASNQCNSKYHTIMYFDLFSTDSLPQISVRFFVFCFLSLSIQYPFRRFSFYFVFLFHFRLFGSVMLIQALDWHFVCQSLRIVPFIDHDRSITSKLQYTHDNQTLSALVTQYTYVVQYNSHWIEKEIFRSKLTVHINPYRSVGKTIKKKSDNV